MKRKFNFLLLVVLLVMLVPFRVSAATELDVIKYYISEPIDGANPDMYADIEFSSSKSDDVVFFQDIKIKWNHIGDTYTLMQETDVFEFGNRYEIDFSDVFFTIHSKLADQGYTVSLDVTEYLNDRLLGFYNAVFCIGAAKFMNIEVDTLVVGEALPAKATVRLVYNDYEEEIEMNIPTWYEYTDDFLKILESSAVVEAGAKYYFDPTFSNSSEKIDKADVTTSISINDKIVYSIEDVNLVGVDLNAQAKNFHESFIKLDAAYKNINFEDLVVAVEEIKPKMEVFYTSNEIFYEKLAKLLKIDDVPKTYNFVASRWVTSSAIVSVGQVYKVYLQERNEQNAKLLVESIDNFQEQFRSIDKLIPFFPNLDYDYLVVKDLLYNNIRDGKGEGEDINVPNTYDGVSSSLILSIVSLFGLFCAVLYWKKKVI